MTTTDQERVRRVVEQSMEMRCRQSLSEDSRQLLAATVREEMRAAVAEGIGAALSGETAEQFWMKGLEVLQKRAQAEAGRFLLDGVAAAIRKALWIGLIVACVYAIGGWSVAKSVWSALVKG